MLQRTKVGLFATVAMLATSGGGELPPTDPPGLWVGGWTWAITEVQREALRPIALRRLAMKKRLDEVIRAITWLKRGQAVPVIVSRSGRMPLDEELPRAASDALRLSIERPCFRPCVRENPFAMERCPESHGIGWPSLEGAGPARVHSTSASGPATRAIGPPAALAARAMSTESDALGLQIDELDAILPFRTDPRHVEDVLRCMAEATGTRLCSVWVDEPRAFSELPSCAASQLAFVASIEGPPPALQDWFLRLARMPELMWFDSVRIRGDAPGSPLVVAEVRGRGFAAPPRPLHPLEHIRLEPRADRRLRRRVQRRWLASAQPISL